MKYAVRGRNFYQTTPDVDVTNFWQEWVVEEGVVNEKDDGSFTFNHDAPTSGPPGQSSNVQTLPTTHARPNFWISKCHHAAYS